MLVYALQNILEGYTQLYIGVAVHRMQQQFVAWNNPLVVNLLINPRASYHHPNVTYLFTIVRTPTPLQWVAIST